MLAGPKTTFAARAPRTRYSRDERLTLHFCSLSGLHPSSFISTRDPIAMERKLRWHLKDEDGLLVTTHDVQTVLDLLGQKKLLT